MPEYVWDFICGEVEEFPSPLGEQGISTVNEIIELGDLVYRFRPLSGNREYQLQQTIDNGVASMMVSVPSRGTGNINLPSSTARPRP